MDIIIRNSTDVPIYAQIIDQIKSMILTGALREGDPLPSMRVLAKELRISIITTKRAYEELEKEGFIVISPGRGSYVATKNAEFLREEHLRRIEEALIGAIGLAQTAGISQSELSQIFATLLEEYQ